MRPNRLCLSILSLAVVWLAIAGGATAAGASGPGPDAGGLATASQSSPALPPYVACKGPEERRYSSTAQMFAPLFEDAPTGARVYICADRDVKTGRLTVHVKGEWTPVPVPCVAMSVRVWVSRVLRLTYVRRCTGTYALYRSPVPGGNTSEAPVLAPLGSEVCVVAAVTRDVPMAFREVYREVVRRPAGYCATVSPGTLAKWGTATR